MVYYSDASYSTIVGTEYFACNGTSDPTGLRTPYRQVAGSGPCS